jgi:hypothetical protein
MPSRIDKFQFVQSGPFLDPTLAPADPLDSIRQILSHPFCVPIPLKVGGAVLQVNRAGAAIQSGPAPTPSLEGKDVRRRADFQNHAVRARTVDRARWN